MLFLSVLDLIFTVITLYKCKQGENVISFKQINTGQLLYIILV